MLGYAGYGDPAGRPIFCFHGIPGSRIAFDPHASTVNARLIAVDRPGIGLSDAKPGRDFERPYSLSFDPREAFSTRAAFRAQETFDKPMP